MNSFQVVMTIVTMLEGGQEHVTRHLQTDMTSCYASAQHVLEELVSNPDVHAASVGCSVNKGEPA